jgi:hypothetical protein
VNKTIYLIFAVLGLLLPYYFLIVFLGAHGFDFPLLIQQIFANQISTFFAVDLIISIFVFWFYLYHEAGKLKMKNWWVYVLASLTVGLSFALPLFLYFREKQLTTNY